MVELGIKRTRVPGWAARSLLVAGLVVGVLVPMAIRPSALHRMLHPGAVPGPVRVTEGT